MIWYILISLFLLLFLWMLFGPVILSVNTEQKRYQLMLPGVVQAGVDLTVGLPYVKGWVFFIPFKFNPFQTKSKKKKKKEKKKTPTLQTLKTSGKKLGNLQLFKDAIRAFRIRKLTLDIDTDDFMLNAWLIPAFCAVNNGRNVHMQINFEGYMFLDLDLRTRIASLIWILIKNR